MLLLLSSGLATLLTLPGKLLAKITPFEATDNNANNNNDDLIISNGLGAWPSLLSKSFSNKLMKVIHNSSVTHSSITQTCPVAL